MPVKKRYQKKTVGSVIKTEMKEGKPHRVAVAAALSMAEKSPKKSRLSKSYKGKGKKK